MPGMDIVLVAGLWLPRSIWSDVAAALEGDGHTLHALALAGVDDGSTTATLHDQIAAVVAAADGADRPLVVGHSAAYTLAWIVADRRPDTVGGVALVGGFPASDGASYADFFELADGVMAFPGWEPFAGPDSAGLDPARRDLIASMAVPVPEPLARGTVRLGDDRRFDIPVTVVCPEFDPGQAREWIAAGDAPELADVLGRCRATGGG